MKQIEISGRPVGENYPAYVIVEIGINHNGDLETAKRLMEVAADAGADAVKFQKRTISTVYSTEELDRYRESPFGKTNRALKEGLEFGKSQYIEIVAHAKKIGLDWFASCWDEASVDFIEALEPACYKIASASLTDDELLRHHRKYDRPIILSTGMSTLEEIDHAIGVLGLENLAVMHCTSSYPSDNSELNLRVIPMFKKRYGVPVGYSGHERGLATSLAAMTMGACLIERHVTLDRGMWGSDQAASIEPPGLKRLVRDIRVIESAMGDGEKRVYESEIPIKDKLRRKG